MREAGRALTFVGCPGRTVLSGEPKLPKITKLIAIVALLRPSLACLGKPRDARILPGRCRIC